MYIYVHALRDVTIPMDVSSGVVGGAVVCHMQCEISSVEVTGLAYTGGGERALFLRCHVPAGGGRTIQIDSHGAAAEWRHGVDDPAGHVVISWRGVASLACDGSPACVRELADRMSVVFEVRRRRRRGAILGRVAGVGSELVGRAEVAWRNVVVAVAGTGDDAAVERRVALAAPARGGGRSAARAAVTAAAPVMSVRMSVRVTETAVPVVRSAECLAAHRETCGCEWSLGNEDMFGVVACAADAFE